MENVIHRCYVLDEQQEKFLRDRRYKIDRHSCFMTLIDKTVRVSTMVDISDHRQLELIQGQFMVSDVELSSLWGVDRKTVSKLMKKMECLGMFTSTKVAEVCVYSMHVLSAWIVDGSLFMNQFYHKPGRPGDKPAWKIPEPNRIFIKTEEAQSSNETTPAFNDAMGKESAAHTDAAHITSSDRETINRSSTSGIDCNAPSSMPHDGDVGN